MTARAIKATPGQNSPYIDANSLCGHLRSRARVSTRVIATFSLFSPFIHFPLCPAASPKTRNLAPRPRVAVPGSGVALDRGPEAAEAYRAKYTKREGKNKVLSFVNFCLAFSIQREYFPGRLAIVRLCRAPQWGKNEGSWHARIRDSSPSSFHQLASCASHAIAACKPRANHIEAIPPVATGGCMSEKIRECANPMNPKWSRWKTILTCAFLLLAIALCDVRSASALPTGKVVAIPAFARKYGLPCSACHTAWPELNNFGQVFRDNGYQLMNDRDSPIWQNPSYFPISFRITPSWHRETTTNQAFDTGNGTFTQAGFDLSGMDLWSAGTIYKNISFVLLPSSDPTAVWHFEAAFIRFDNLKGSPWLNLRFGRFEMDNMI